MRPDIYFDLDGTLTDPFEGISKSIVFALDRLGEPAPDEQRLRDCIGPPLYESFESLAGSNRAGEALALYRERFADVGWRENLPYAGIKELLGSLHGGGRDVFVATSKPRVFAEKIVAHFGFAPYIREVFGSELDGTRTDKGELLAHALSITGSQAAVMVGDRKHDAIGAAKNAMSFVGVSYGYGGADELQAAGATQIADGIPALRALLVEA